MSAGGQGGAPQGAEGEVLEMEPDQGEQHEEPEVLNQPTPAEAGSELNYEFRVNQLEAGLISMQDM
eukprot:7171792-Prorocentrum_lima.AAC.1